MDEEKKLYIVATPIGNLSDITFRAIETLKAVDVILCEDTRVSKKLLDHYDIQKPLVSYHQRSNQSKVEKIIELLEQKNTLALVTDAGTPGISDPGNELVHELIGKFQDSLAIIPIPGAAALTTLIQAAGINLSKFTFLGFPPNKKGRETFFKELLQSPHPVIYYESPHRLLKNLELLKTLSDAEPPKIIVGRELTKLFEQIRRGTVEQILEYYQAHADKVRGEFVIIAYR